MLHVSIYFIRQDYCILKYISNNINIFLDKYLSRFFSPDIYFYFQRIFIYRVFFSERIFSCQSIFIIRLFIISCTFSVFSSSYFFPYSLQIIIVSMFPIQNIFPFTVFTPLYYLPWQYFPVFYFHRIYPFRVIPLQNIFLLQSLFPNEKFSFRFPLMNMCQIQNISPIKSFILKKTLLQRLFTPREFFHYKVFSLHRTFPFRFSVLAQIFPSQYLSQIYSYLIQCIILTEFPSNYFSSLSTIFHHNILSLGVFRILRILILSIFLSASFPL